MTLGFSVRLGRIALTRIQEISQVFYTVENSGSDTKETDAPGFTGSKEGDEGDA